MYKIIILTLILLSLAIASVIFIYPMAKKNINIYNPVEDLPVIYEDLYYNIEQPNIILVKNKSGGFEEW